MQQTVAILLNEREPQKKEIAEALELELQREGITTSRIESSPKLGEEVLAAQPSLIVVDYILEDYGTGLDLLEACRATKRIHRPTCIFLTDEPSLQVAIAAMKLGASDYLLSTDVHALSECVSFIKSQVAKTKQITEYRKQIRRTRKKKDLVLTSDAMTAVMESLLAELQKNPEVVVLVGEKGVGKRTLARTLVRELDKLPLCIEAEQENSPINALLGRAISTFESLEGEATQASIILEDVSLLTVQLAEQISGELHALTQRLQGSPFPFFVTTTDSRVAEAFRNAFATFSCKVPSLEEGRESEISQLVQKFLFEAANTYKADVPKLTAKELKWFSEQRWPENIAQLKRVVETFTAATDIISGDSKEEKLERVYQLDQASKSITAELQALRENPLDLFETMVQARGNLGTCAQLLGCSVADVYELMQHGGEGQ